MPQSVNAPVLRLIDANANRAREALRGVEDYARFVLDDDTLCGSLKHVRHELTEALRDLLPDAILHRNVPGDVGTALTTMSEGSRQNVRDVVTAAGKRFGEAVRTIEECLKIVEPGRAPAVESLRYRFYDIEQRVAFTLRPGADRFAELHLYVLITESQCTRPWLETAELALLGGADCLQLREKDLDSGELLRRADQLVQLCHRHGALCIINDRPDVALLSRADGVHVGQGDLPARGVRKLVGNDKIVGVSTHNPDQARQAVLDGADYIGVGPVYRSATKPRDFLPGLDYARHAAHNVKIPSVAIAGITAGNVDEVLSTGIRAIAVTAAVTQASDPRAAAAALKARTAQGENAK